MPASGTIVLILKILVVAVTLLLLVGLVALARGNVRLHGRINLVFFVLTMATVFGFEGLLQLGPELEDGWQVTRGWTANEKLALKVHLAFVFPLLVVMPAMLITGWRHLRRLHLTLALVFSISWMGMLVTGVGFLPHGERAEPGNPPGSPASGDAP